MAQAAAAALTLVIALAIDFMLPARLKERTARFCEPVSQRQRV
jgi:hypothetical protein